ncbi:MAG: PQQ-binding-like beta-propeller repeat protein [bacterium]|nr:PQQ-binding-like beta-propeller repeat protein [bacterium]
MESQIIMRDRVSKCARSLGVCGLLALAATACERTQEPAAPQPTTDQGRWVTTESGEENEDHNLIEQLMAIGYLRGSRDDMRSGVTVHDPSRAFAGYNLYTSGHAPEALLIDMEGEVIHRWHLSYEEAFGPLEKPNSNAEWWRRVVAFPNGDLLAIYEGLGLVKIDKHSKLIWKSELDAHHDLEALPNGDIYVLTRKAHLVPRIDPEAPILEDFVSVLNHAGKLVSEISLLEAFEKSRFADLIHPGLVSGNGDIFHTNTVAMLQGRALHRDRAFRNGNLLVSMNRMGVVAAVSLKIGQVIWVRRTAPVGQHDPKILPGGNMLLFSNHMGTGSSVVEEFDPKSGEVAWSYRGTDDHPFYSKYLGAADRLPNGNTLITESDGGRAFEITREGEIVWEFYNPHRAGEDGAFIATLPEVIRLPAGIPLGWATGDDAAGS